ncbi:hypothetical protein [Halobacterium noricense]|uniref:hypothetical protein n=1 Tax=Halobacterium noricense TaxID=223182 RepID=UPI001E4348F6|nr:hypothetical protein [Halobacterium noricense]UHH24800.1 hypothetical protein LT974_12525 [Halobacterium noricense]
MSDSVLSGNTFTFREWHAGVLGAAVGAFASYLHAIDYTSLGVALAVVFVAAALGLRRYGSVAGRTVRREPWYALAAFVVAGAAVFALA